VPFPSCDTTTMIDSVTLLKCGPNDVIYSQNPHNINSTAIVTCSNGTFISDAQSQQYCVDSSADKTMCRLLCKSSNGQCSFGPLPTCTQESGCSGGFYSKNTRISTLCFATCAAVMPNELYSTLFSGGGPAGCQSCTVSAAIGSGGCPSSNPKDFCKQSVVALINSYVAFQTGTAFPYTPQQVISDVQNYNTLGLTFWENTWKYWNDGGTGTSRCNPMCNPPASSCTPNSPPGRCTQPGTDAAQCMSCSPNNLNAYCPTGMGTSWSIDDTNAVIDNTDTPSMNDTSA